MALFLALIMPNKIPILPHCGGGGAVNYVNGTSDSQIGAQCSSQKLIKSMFAGLILVTCLFVICQSLSYFMYVNMGQVQEQSILIPGISWHWWPELRAPAKYFVLTLDWPHLPTVFPFGPLFVVRCVCACLAVCLFAYLG